MSSPDKHLSRIRAEASLFEVDVNSPNLERRQSRPRPPLGQILPRLDIGPETGDQSLEIDIDDDILAEYGDVGDVSIGTHSDKQNVPPSSSRAALIASPAPRKIFQELVFYLVDYPGRSSVERVTIIMNGGGRIATNITASNIIIFPFAREEALPTGHNLQELVHLALPRPCVSFEWLLRCLEQRKLHPYTRYSFPPIPSLDKIEPFPSLRQLPTPPLRPVEPRQSVLRSAQSSFDSLFDVCAWTQDNSIIILDSDDEAGVTGENEQAVPESLLLPSPAFPSHAKPACLQDDMPACLQDDMPACLQDDMPASTSSLTPPPEVVEEHNNDDDDIDEWVRASFGGSRSGEQAPRTLASATPDMPAQPIKSSKNSEPAQPLPNFVPLRIVKQAAPIQVDQSLKGTEPAQPSTSSKRCKPTKKNKSSGPPPTKSKLPMSRHFVEPQGTPAKTALPPRRARTSLSPSPEVALSVTRKRKPGTTVSLGQSSGRPVPVPTVSTSVTPPTNTLFDPPSPKKQAAATILLALGQGAAPPPTPTKEESEGKRVSRATLMAQPIPKKVLTPIQHVMTLMETHTKGLPARQAAHGRAVAAARAASPINGIPSPIDDDSRSSKHTAGPSRIPMPETPSSRARLQASMAKSATGDTRGDAPRRRSGSPARDQPTFPSPMRRQSSPNTTYTSAEPKPNNADRRGSLDGAGASRLPGGGRPHWSSGAPSSSKPKPSPSHAPAFKLDRNASSFRPGSGAGLPPRPSNSCSGSTYRPFDSYSGSTYRPSTSYSTKTVRNSIFDKVGTQSYAPERLALQKRVSNADEELSDIKFRSKDRSRPPPSFATNPPNDRARSQSADGGLFLQHVSTLQAETSPKKRSSDAHEEEARKRVRQEADERR